MGNLRPIADRMLLYCHRSLPNVRCSCFDPAKRFYNSSSCGGFGTVNDDGFPSFYRLSSEFWLHGMQPQTVRSSSLPGGGNRIFEKAPPFPSARRRLHGIELLPVRSPSLHCFSRERLLLGGSRSFEKAAPFYSTRRRFSSAPKAAAAAAVEGSSAAAVTTGATRLPSSTFSSPFLIIPPSADSRKIEDGNDFYHMFNIAEQKEIKIRKVFGWQRNLLLPDDAICFGSSHGWLGLIDRRNCYPYLLNPFNSSSRLPFYAPLPALETLPVVRGFTVSRSDCDSPTPSLTKRYIKFKDDTDSEFHATMTQYLNNLSFRNLIMSSPPSLDPFSCSSSHYGGGNANNDNNCTLMAMYGGNIGISKVAFCKAGDETWSVLEEYGSPKPRNYVQVAYFSKDGCFYAVDGNCSIEAIDLSDPSSPKMTTVIDEPDPHPHNPNLSEKEQSLLLNDDFYKKRTYLVESSGDLFLVLRFIAHNVSKDGTPHEDFTEQDITSEINDCILEMFMFEYRTLRFEVYKLDFHQKRWEFVECLGDRALFVGCNQPFSLSTSDFPHLRTNSIYFTDSNHVKKGDRQCTFHDNGVFNLEDGCVTPYYQPSLKRIEPYYPPSSDLFEQPPIFVALNTW